MTSSLRRLSFSSEALPAHLTRAQRAELWFEAASGGGQRQDVDSPDRENFYGRSCSVGLGNFLITSAQTNALDLHRKTRHVAADQNDTVTLLVNISDGAVGGRQFGREVDMQRGEACFFDNANEFQSWSRNGGEIVGLYIPRNLFTSRRIAIEDHAARIFSVANNNALGLLTEQLRIFLKTENFDPAIEVAGSQFISALIQSIVAPTANGLAEGQPAELRISMIREAIKSRCNNANFGLEDLAKLVKLSPRYIQRLFQNEGTTVGQEITDQRLAQFCREFATSSNERISDIAYRCGFSDLSTFHRAFRRRFNASPRQYLK
jgi:AraC-like DNA-binding protein